MRVVRTETVPLATIVVGDYEVRTAESDPELPALAESIRNDGLLVALGVVEKGDGLHLVHGHRRYSACIMARVSSVRVDVLEGDKAGLERASIIENYHRRDISAMERAAQIAAVVENGTMKVDELAEVFHRSVEWVNDQIAMMAWPGDVQGAVHRGQLSVGAAEHLAKIRDDSYRGFLVMQAVESGCTARTAQSWLAGWRAMLPVETVAAQTVSGGDGGAPRQAPQSMCVKCKGMMSPEGLVPVYVCPRCVVALREE